MVGHLDLNGVWPVHFVIAGTSGTSTPAGVWHDICLCRCRLCSGAVYQSQLRRAERHTRGTSRGNAGGRAWVVCIRRTWDRVLHTADMRRLARCRRLDQLDWSGTSDSLLGRTVRTAKRVDAWHGTCVCLAELRAGNLHTVIGTALTPCAWRRSRLHWFAALWTDFAGLGRCTGWAQPDRFVFGVVRAFVWPIHFLATCTGWKGTALTPRAWGRHWFHSLGLRRSINAGKSNHTKQHTRHTTKTTRKSQPDLRFVKEKQQTRQAKGQEPKQQNPQKRFLPRTQRTLPLCHTQKHA